MMIDSNIRQLRLQLQTFFQSNERATEFMVNCDLKYRIHFIYSVIFPQFKKYKFYWRFFLSRIAFHIDYSPIKILIYRAIGVKIGKGVFISPDVSIDVHFPYLVQIDDYAILGYGCRIFCHDFFTSKYRIGRVHIGRGAVIGAYTNVCCGVHVGEMANVSLQSMLLKDVPPFYKSGIKASNE